MISSANNSSRFPGGGEDDMSSEIVMRRGISAVVVLLVICIIALVALVLFKSGSLNLNQKFSEKTRQFTNREEQTVGENTERLSTFANNLEVPWSIAFLPEGKILVTERPGRIVQISKDGSTKETIANVDQVKHFGEGGLMGLAIHPNFPSNNFVYLYYTYEGSGSSTLNRVSRMIYKDGALGDEKVIVDAIPGAIYHNGGRIKFGPDGFLYITTGDANQPSQAQNTDSLAGKILRVTPEGYAAPGNPFGNLVYSYGHRNPQGITWDETGQLWETEHGPSGIWPNCCQDEVNLIQAGKNYGWPDSVGDRVLAGTLGPTSHSGRNIWAPGGVSVVGDSLFYTGLRGEALYKYSFSNGTTTEHLKGEFGRLREVVAGPDGNLYVTTSNKDGRGDPESDDDKILKINPKKL